MIAQDSYRFVLDSKSGASVCAESVTLPGDLGSPLVWKTDVFPQQRPNRKYFTGQAASDRFSGTVEIVVHWKQPIRFELTENTSQFLLKPIDGVEEIPAIHVEVAATQLPIGGEEKVIPEDTILYLC